MIDQLGDKLPSVELASTSGGFINPALMPGLCVYYCYPYTGRPGVPDPENWDNIPGAHGSTPQSQAYSAAYDNFNKLNVKVFGISLQDTAWQAECVLRLGLRWPLLSDHAEAFTNALDIPTFKTGGRRFLDRTTLVVRDGNLTVVRIPLEEPENDAWEILHMLGG